MTQQLLCPNCGHHVADIAPRSETTPSSSQPDDSLSQFIAERCTLAADERIAAPEFRAAYTAWCGERGEFPLGTRSVGRLMAERPDVTTRRSNGTRFFYGITLS